MYRSDPDLREKVREAYRDLAREDSDDLEAPRDLFPPPPRTTTRAPGLAILTVVLLAAVLLAVMVRIADQRDVPLHPVPAAPETTGRIIPPGATTPGRPRDTRPASTAARAPAQPSRTRAPVVASPPSVPRQDSLLVEQGLQLMRAGAVDEACDRFAAAWRAAPGYVRARVDATAVARAERECRRDFSAGAVLYERALQPVTPSP